LLLEPGEEYDRPSRRGSIVPKVKVRSRKGSKDNLLEFDAEGDPIDGFDDDEDNFLRGSINSASRFPDEYQTPNSGIQQRSTSVVANPLAGSAPQNQFGGIRATNVAFGAGANRAGGNNVGREIKESLKRSRTLRKKRSLSADAAKIAENRPF